MPRTSINTDADLFFDSPEIVHSPYGYYVMGKAPAFKCPKGRKGVSTLEDCLTHYREDNLGLRDPTDCTRCKAGLAARESYSEEAIS